MATVLFVLAMVALAYCMVRYHQRAGRGETRDESAQGWDARSSDGGSGDD